MLIQYMCVCVQWLDKTDGKTTISVPIPGEKTANEGERELWRNAELFPHKRACSHVITRALRASAENRSVSAQLLPHVHTIHHSFRLLKAFHFIWSMYS